MTYHIGIISTRRPSSPATMLQHVKGFDVTWYVKDKTDLLNYIENGADKVVIGGGLGESRNMILKDAWKNNNTAVMMDDDLVKIYMMTRNQDKVVTTLKQTLEELSDALDGSGLYLAGAAPTVNEFYYNSNKPYSFKNFIIAALMMVRPCELLFDENLRTKEDYDYTLQHIAKYGGAVRLDYIMPHFRHYGNEGGVVDYRTPEVENSSIKYLKAKWGKIIRDNPKRPNEILMKV